MENTQHVRFMFSGQQTALMWNILKEILIKQAYKKDGKKPLEDLFNDMTVKLEPYLVDTNNTEVKNNGNGEEGNGEEGNGEEGNGEEGNGEEAEVDLQSFTHVNDETTVSNIAKNEQE